MKVEDIPSDEVVSMTAVLHRAFKVGGCNPICHCCIKPLPIGSNFKLATVEAFDADSTKEVMLCDTCTVDDMNNMTDKKRKEYEKSRSSGGGCYRVNGQIVH